jgi:hypothetical protein
MDWAAIGKAYILINLSDLEGWLKPGCHLKGALFGMIPTKAVTRTNRRLILGAFLSKQDSGGSSNIE